MSTKTADYDHIQDLNGVGAFVFSVRDKGQEITVAGWLHDRRKFKAGQRVLFRQESGEETRYRILRTDFPSDPPDQYFLDCRFDPRKP